MLKVLLGHWKAHRKKPSLLPEEGDIHFEEPSTINPLFEDSDSSISSTKRTSNLTAEEQNDNPLQRDDEQNENVNGVPVVNELIDVSVPTENNDTNVVLTENNDTNVKALPEDAETAIREVETVIKEVEAVSNYTAPKSYLHKTEKKDELVSNSEPISEPRDLQNGDLSNDLKSIDINPTSSKSSPQEKSTNDNLSKSNEKTTVNKSENMRISDQPSTSAIKQNNQTSNNNIEKNASQISNSKTSTEQKKSGNATNKANKSENKSAKPTSTPLKSNGENSMPQQNMQIDNSEKPAKLRARAIDELIKKFQGPSTENDKITNNAAKQEVKSWLHHSAETNNPVKNVTKFEEKNKPSPSKGNDENISKISKSVENTSPKVTKPEVQSNTSNKNEVQKEALSNIFKFPPPPPLEQLQNQSSLHGKIAAQRKSSNVPPTLNNINENSDNSKENEEGKTRSDSSLERTRTTSSNKLKTISEKKTPSNSSTSVKDPSFKATVEQVPADNKSIRFKDLPAERNNTKEPENEISQTKPTKESKPSVLKPENTVKAKPETKLSESQPQSSSGSFTAKRESPVLNSKLKINSNDLQKNSFENDPPKVKTSPVPKKKSSISKTSAKVLLTNENENGKSHSEDSGITRGDQISSEATQDIPQGSPSDDIPTGPNTSKKNRKDKKLKSIHKKACKNCRRVHDDSTSLKRSQCDEYYDGLTGTRHLHRGRHSDSWNSDLSWEERELLRRLRSKRGTVRSNTPSTRSRHSRHRFINEDHFRRHHNFRRSVSDESTFYGSSLCSCDECYAMYMKDYAYGRASLRGMSPIQEMCTCRTYRHNLLGRRVQFRSDTIHEASPSERTTRTTTPAPPTEKNQEENEEDDKSSQQSSKTKDDESVRKHPEGTKEKKSKAPEENYRYVTPWELEEWDLLMRKHLLQRRRRRARCMGIMALAMVVFVGLVVAILMVYLRRKVI